jgi:hypothetical protein
MLYNQQGQQIQVKVGHSVPVWAREKLEPPTHKGHPFFRLEERAKIK